MSAFSSLAKELRTYLNEEQVEFVRQAYLLADKAHRHQTRTSGEAYIIHPIVVAKTLASMRMDAQCIAAALLHDVLEDTSVNKDTLIKSFGQEVANLVDGVSKLTQISFETRAEAQAENFQKMVMAMADDIRVILIKLADRLHNMETLVHLDFERRHRIAKETLEIYAPIANRLGMNNLRIAFEELGFERLHPMRYRVMSEAVKKARGNRKEIMSLIETSLSDVLENTNLIDFQLIGREKHLYSIYKKMRAKHLPFSEIMDVYAFRVIVKSVDDCYRALGAVHSVYKPVPAKFKDYIAIPKVNGYQSLHTILFGPYGVPIETQIRTYEMHKMAENGIAAHWLYKTDDHIVDHAQVRAREWIKGLLEIQQNAGNPLEFIENVKIDLFPDEVYVFTPAGEIMELPAGATAVDFAYAVHSDVGNSCVAVKIDRRLYPLSARLKNGQTIEIITAKGARPNPAWLDFSVTAKARSRIRHYLKHQKRTESISLGKRLLEKALMGQSSKFSDVPKRQINSVLKISQMIDVDDLFESIGLGNQMAPIVARRLLGKEDLTLKEAKKREEAEPLKIRGSEGMVVSFAKCCRPVPGDPIEGVLTAGHGIVIHHSDCNNLDELRRQPDKCILVRWEEKVQGEFEVELQIDIVNQRGVLASLALAVANAEANVDHINIQERNGHCSLITLVITVNDRAHLARVIRGMRHIKNITSINRNCNAGL